jgi:hypothetical protein
MPWCGCRPPKQRPGSSGGCREACEATDSTRGQ